MQAFYYDQAEEFGDGFSNEFQRAFFVSSLHANRVNHTPAAAFLSAIGRFAVLSEHEVCCPATDGLIGYSVVLEDHFASRAEAEAFVGDRPIYGEHVWVYEPPVAPEPVSAPVPVEDDIPF